MTGGKLYLQLPGLPKWELSATAGTALFVRTMSWNLSFTRANGQVTTLANTQRPLVWKVPKMMTP
ncbi:hypothetical protein GCM10027299_08190 [Larkinella ripae]